MSFKSVERGIERAVELGCDFERERIIILLDEHFAFCERMTYECEVCSDRINLIALIRGENE
jgi:hypothetical protein